MGHKPLVVIAEDDEVMRPRKDPETLIDQDNHGAPVAHLFLQSLHRALAGACLKSRILSVALEIGDEGPLKLVAIDPAADDLLVHGSAVIGQDGGKGSGAAELRFLLNERNALDLKCEGVRSQKKYEENDFFQCTLFDNDGLVRQLQYKDHQQYDHEDGDDDSERVVGACKDLVRCLGEQMDLPF